MSTDNLFSKKDWSYFIQSEEIKYIESDFLGEGNYGKVYKGTCRGFPVAIKIPQPKGGKEFDNKQISAFKQEVEVWQKIAHPNVALFMGAYISKKEIKIVTELLDADFEKLLFTKGKTWSLFDRVRYAQQAASGMAWLHGAGVIHCDFKPSNLLYCKKEDSVKVCDFGLSLLVPMGQILSTEECAGTPLYVAPEALENDHIDHSRDVYSFGIALYEFITLKEPFQEYDNLSEFLQAICLKKNPARPKLPSDPFKCPESLQKLAEHCWHASPTKRPTFEEIVSDFQKNILIDCAIFDKDARKFWKTNFQTPDDVPFEKFATCFSKISKLDLKHTSPHYKCLDSLFASTVEGNKVVTLKNFGYIIGFFIKFLPSQWLKYVTSICSEPWFWGNTSAAEAEKALQKGVGEYLIRFSSSESNYTLSYAVEDRIYHTRVIHPYGSLDFTVDGQSGKKTYKGLEELVKENMKMLGLTKSCQGSPFSIVFKETIDFSQQSEYKVNIKIFEENDENDDDEFLS